MIKILDELMQIIRVEILFKMQVYNVKFKQNSITNLE